MGIKRGRRSYHLWHPFTNMATFFGESVMFVEGRGTKIRDENGREYINAMSCLWNTHCGLGREEIIEAIDAQLTKLSFCSITRLAHPSAIELADKLVEITPSGLNKVFLANTGSEAIESAIKMMRQYSKLKGNPEKYKIISLNHSYHGVSMGALSASGVPSMQEPFEPLLPGFIQIPPAYCYRCAYGKRYPECDIECALALERVIQSEGPENIGGFLIEPVMSFAGGIIPPGDYFQRVKDICKKYGVKLIFDEISTGFGRLGRMFAADHFKISPDIMALSKGINSGYLPLGATMATDEIYETFLDKSTESTHWSWANQGIFAHGSTTDGHPACCASALANIAIIEGEDLVGNSRRIGEYLLGLCQEFSRFSFVGDIRGLGLLISIEFVEDKKSRQPLTGDQVFMISTRLFKSGLFAYCMGNTLTLFPPLIFTKGDADETCHIMKKSFEKVEKMIC